MVSKRGVAIVCMAAVASMGAAMVGLGLYAEGQAQSNDQAVQSSTPQGSTPASPKEKAQQPDASSVIRVNTRMVVVDVIALDAKGDVIRDLKGEDLKVFEDGKEQQIKAFSFHQPGAGAAPQATKLADHEVTNIPRYSATSSFNIIVLDTLNTVFTDQAYAREEVLKFTQRLPNDQPVAVFGLSSKGLQLVQDFTTDPELLKKAVHGMKGELSPFLVNSGGNLGAGNFRGANFGAARPVAQQQVAQWRTARTEITMEAFRALGPVLGHYSGRKNVIWLTDGIAAPMGGFGPDFESASDYEAALSKTAESLRSGQIAVYPIDVRGLATSSFLDASNGRARSVGSSLNRDFAQNSSIHSGMNDLAEKTGGRAFYNRNDVDNLVAKSMEDGSTYYTIGYYPENKNWNGRFRRIRVTIQRPEAKLRYRIGYYATNSGLQAQNDPDQAEEDFGRALNIEFPAATDLLFKATVTPPSAETKNKVIVNFAIQPDGLRFVDQQDGLHHATIKCGVHAFSAKGVPLKFAVETMEASLKPETFKNVMQNGFPCQQEIDLPAGTYTLRLGVRDDRTGLTGSTNAQVTIAKK